MDDRSFDEFRLLTSSNSQPFLLDLNFKPEEQGLGGHELCHLQNIELTDPIKAQKQKLEKLIQYIHPVVDKLNISNVVIKNDLLEEMGGSVLRLEPQKRGKAESKKRPEWLPENWEIKVKERKSGISIGNTDKYYVEPDERRLFRSKNEVLHFLETGKRKRRKNDNALVRKRSSRSTVKDQLKLKWALMNASQALNIKFQ